MLSSAAAHEMTATTVVGVLGGDDVDAFRALVAEISDEYGLEATLKLHQGSYSVRLSPAWQYHYSLGTAMVDLGQDNVRVTPRDGRPAAEEMLERVRRQAGAGARGRHRVYLGHRARRRQDVHRPRGAAPPQGARHRRGHRLSRNARPPENRRARRRPRSRAAQADSVQGRDRRRDGHRGGHPAPPGRCRWSTSSRTPTRPARSTRSAGRTSKSCSRRASPSSAP